MNWSAQASNYLMKQRCLIPVVAMFRLRLWFLIAFLDFLLRLCPEMGVPHRLYY